MKTRFKTLGKAAVVAGFLLAASSVYAEEVNQQTQAQVKQKANLGDEADIAAEELMKQGAVNAEQVEALKAQIRERLRLHANEGKGLCSDGEKEKCQAKLRKQIRDCDAEGRKQGSVKSTEDSARVASALMLAAGKSEDIDEAGDVVRGQLQKKWKSEDVEEAAKTMNQMKNKERWQKQARQMLRDCVSEEACTPEQAKVTLKIMHQASGCADMDPRQARKEIKRALKEQKAEQQKAQSDKSASKQGLGEALKTRLQQRLRLHAQENASIAGTGNGEQKRNRYRCGMDSESRQGGGFGGGQSGGAGKGYGGGSSDNTGGSKKGSTSQSGTGSSNTGVTSGSSSDTSGSDSSSSSEVPKGPSGN